MTFDEWWDKDDTKLKCIWCEKEEAALAWNAATAAERQRCREIVDDCGRYVDIVEMLEKIGE